MLHHGRSDLHLWTWLLCLSMHLDFHISSMSAMAQSATLYLNSHAHCTSNVYLVSQAQMFHVVDKRRTPIKSTACRRCELLFKADAEAGHICIETSVLKFNDCHTTLSFVDSSETDVHDSLPVKYDCHSALTLPEEWCSGSRYAAVQLEPLGACQSGGQNVEVSLVIRHISNFQRIAYLDAGCGQVLGLSESRVEIRNRRPGRSNSLPLSCQLSAEYVGAEEDEVVCLKLTAKTCSYAFQLKVYDGMGSDKTFSQSYTCRTENPYRWCSDSPSLTLEMQRDDTVDGETEPLDLFTIEVTDEKKTEVMKILSTESRLSSMRVVLIVAVICSCVVVAIIIVTVLAFILVRRQQRRLRGGASPVSTDPYVDEHQL